MVLGFRMKPPMSEGGRGAPTSLTDAGALRLADAPPIEMGLRALRGHAKAALTGRLTD